MMATRASLFVMLVNVLFLTGSSCEAQTQAPSIRIIPTTNDITLFQGSEFRRVCTVEGVSGDVMVRFVWERDGQLIDSSEAMGILQLQLRIAAVEQVHVGEYSCHVVLTPQTGGTPATTLGPMTAGTLTVLDRDLIDAPSTQIIREGASGALNCSYPGGFVTWRQAAISVTGVFSSATFSDEGLYTCDVFVPDPSASVGVPVMLYVVVPVQIVDTSRPVHQNLTSNEPVTFAVEFRGRQTHDLTIAWFHDGVPIPVTDTRIHDSFDSSLASGRAELRLPLARRSDVGLYRVVISSEVGVPPVFSSQQEVTFQIDVTVRPAPPADLGVDQLFSTTARVSWALTSQMPDQHADHFILRLTFSNRRLAEQVLISGDQTSHMLQHLVPANDYSLVLTAVNTDGQVTTNPITFRSLEGSPAIKSVQIERVNRTWFNVEIELAYTGGGAVTKITMSYSPTAGNGVRTRLPNVVPVVVGAGLRLRAMVVFPDENQGEAGMQLEFTIEVHNEFNFKSAPVVSDTVLAFVPPVNPTTVHVTTTPSPFVTSATPETTLLPPWLMAVIASVVTILVMILLVACIVGVCVRCRSTKSDKFRVQVQSVSTLSAESGILHTKSLDSLPADQYRARSQTSSVPSDNYTPSLDEHYLEKKHKRELSECSSVGLGKVTITPSTTASNSPANFNNKAHFINSQEKGLDCINELETSRSDDSGTESERDRIRQQMLSQQNIMNSQYVRGYADGSVCCSSHHSLVSSSGPPSAQLYPHSHSLSYSDPKHLHAISSSGRRGGGTEYMYSDCESVASTDVSYSNVSMPSNITLQQHHQRMRPVQYRSPTPYNHDFRQNAESTVSNNHQEESTVSNNHQEESTV